jgi:PilZ domain
MQFPLKEFSSVVNALRDPSTSIGAPEKRRTSRMSVSHRLNLHVLESGAVRKSYTVLARDISLTGLGVLQGFELLVDQEVMLELPRHHEPTLLVRARVMNCRALADGIMAVGFEFLAVVGEADMASRIAPHRAGASAAGHSNR